MRSYINLDLNLKIHLNEVKCTLTELTTRSNCKLLMSVVLLYLRMRWIPRGLRSTACLSVWREEGALCVESLSFFPSLPPPPPLYYFPLSISVTGACLLEGVGAHGWLACQVLPFIGAVFSLAANSGNSRMAQAPNLH